MSENSLLTFLRLQAKNHSRAWRPTPNLLEALPRRARLSMANNGARLEPPTAQNMAQVTYQSADGRRETARNRP